MDKERFLQHLGIYRALSAGLAAYLNYVLTEEKFRAKDRLDLDKSELNALSFLYEGSARLYLRQEGEKEESTLWFYLQGDFPHLQRDLSIAPGTKLTLEFLEDTTLQLIADKHLSNLYKVFSEFHQIQIQISAALLKKTFLHQISQNQLKAEKRYDQFLKDYPMIALVCEQKKIASFLGIDPKTLSRLRGKSVRS